MLILEYKFWGIFFPLKLFELYSHLISSYLKILKQYYQEIFINFVWDSSLTILSTHAQENFDREHC